MEKIVVNVSWCNKNFGASLSENVPGAVAITAKTYDELVDQVRETLKFHIEGMIADGDDVPQWCAKATMNSNIIRKYYHSINDSANL